MSLLPLCMLALVHVTAGETVHLVFGNHLDIGFDNVEPFLGFDDNVINMYFHEYFPRAVRLAEAMRSAGRGELFRYTSHSYLLSLFMDCPPGMGLKCPGPAAVSRLKAAIAAGDITWHAHPHNAQYEFYSHPGLLAAAFGLTHRLDEQLGQRRKQTAILRDVPGITRAALPVMAAQGVAALSVGVNGGSAPPGVPKFTPFIWKDPHTGAQVVAFWHPGGYGGYTQGVAVDPPHQCIRAPGHDHVLCTSWRNDNSGPPLTTMEVQRVYQLLRAAWPNATLLASSFDDYVDQVLRDAPVLQLPVVTEEIGDTWIYGVASDPRKTSDFRAAARLHASCRADPSCDSEGYAFLNFTRLLLKVPEHTWGLDVKKHLHDMVNYSNADFHACLPRPPSAAGRAARAPCPNYGHLLHAWQRQAAYIDWAVQALPPLHPVRAGFTTDAADRELLAGTSAEGLLAAGASQVALQPGRRYAFDSHAWRVEVDADTGGISRLQRLHNKSGGPSQLGVDWGGTAGVPLLQLQYNVYCERSYDVIWTRYAWQYPRLAWWFEQDFGKFNSSAAWDREVVQQPSLEALFQRQGSGGSLLLALRYRLPKLLVVQAGAPASLWLLLESKEGSEKLDVTAVWQDKTATRLPEALWLLVRPSGVDTPSWRLTKLGSQVSPSEVMLNGSQSMHAVSDEGISVRSADGAEVLSVATLDAALASPGAVNPFPNGVTPPDMSQGVGFNLVNNVWGTNYIMWCPYTPRDARMAFRFSITSELQRHGIQVWRRI